VSVDIEALRYGMLRVEYQRMSDPNHRIALTRSQNRKYERDVKPYRHASFQFRIGSFALNVYVHNDHGRSGWLGGSGWYWEWRSWGFSWPRSPFWKIKSYGS